MDLIQDEIAVLNSCLQRMNYLQQLKMVILIFGF